MIASVLLGAAALPFVYYLIAIVSSLRFFTSSQNRGPGDPFTPPVSNLKPIKGIDPDAYENLASFCRQDYPAEHELLLCVDEGDQHVAPIVERLEREFPEQHIRVLFGSGRVASNDKVAKLVRLVSEARHEVIVISDSDVRVAPDYLKTVTAPLSDPQVGAVTCFYVHAPEKTFAERLQTIGMISDFYAGVLVAWQLDGIKFALGPTIVTTRARLAGFGGYQALENRPADDLLVGRLIADQGYRVKLLPYSVVTVADYHSVGDLLQKRMRWIVVMRHLRPWGHFGLLFTQGLPWSLAAVALHPTAAVAIAYLGLYLALRICMTSIIGVWALKQPGAWRTMGLIPIWDVAAFFIWLASFLRSSVRWRGADYYIRDGRLVPVAGNKV